MDYLTPVEKLILEGKLDHKYFKYNLNEQKLLDEFSFKLNLLGKRKLPKIRLERLLSRLGREIKNRYGMITKKKGVK